MEQEISNQEIMEKLSQMQSDIDLIKEKLDEEEELSDWAKKELEETRERTDKLSHEEVKEIILGK